MKKLFLVLFSIVIMFSACKRDVNTEPTPTTPTSMEDLSVTSTFDWKTTKDYILTLTGTENNIFEVKSEQGATYQRAFLTANVQYTTKITVPSYEKKILIKYLGNEVVLELNSSNLSYQF